jgi:hypothetical protein
MRDRELTALEQRVRLAFGCGELVDMRPSPHRGDDLRDVESWPPERRLRAEFLTELLTGQHAARGGVPALRLAGVAVYGELRLEAAEVPHLVDLTGCWFSNRLDLRMARLAGLRLPGCRVPGLRGHNMSVNSDLVLEAGFISTGQVDLTDANVAGSLRLSGAVLRKPGGHALLADRLVASGAIQARALRADGSVRLPNARVGGSVDIGAAVLSNPNGDALHAVGIDVSGSVNAEVDGGRFTADGRVVLSGARIGGDLRLSGAKLTVPESSKQPVLVIPRGIADGSASLVADRVEVRGNVELDGGFTAVGTVRLPGARIGGYLRLAGATLGTSRKPVPGLRVPIALLADGIRINGDLDGRGWRGADQGTSRQGLLAYGQVRFVDADIRGSASLSGVQLHGPGLDVLFADRIRVGGTLFLRNAKVSGSIRLQDARIGSTLDCTGAELTEPRHRPDGSPKPSLDIRVSTIGKDVFCTRGFTATGGVRARRMEASKTVSFEGATLGGEQGAVALNASGLHAEELNLRFAGPPAGDVLLTRASTVEVFDDEALWRTAGLVDLEDFKYETLTAKPEVDVGTRLRWLRSVLRHYDPDPYERLAASYVDAGREERSRRVLLVNQRHRHATMRLPGRVWGWVQEVTVGYGYRPLLALLWFLVLWTAGSLWFAFFYTPEQIDPDNRPVFNPVLFALDTLLPIVNLGQDEHWRTQGAAQWIAVTLTLVGWVLVTAAAAGAARVLKRG